MKGKLKRHLTLDQIEILEKCKKKEAKEEYIGICHKNLICPKCGSKTLVRIEHRKWWRLWDGLTFFPPIPVEFKCYNIGCDYRAEYK